MAWRPTRRGWFLATLGALGLVAAGGYQWRRLRRPTAGDLAGLIERRLSHLNLDPAAPAAFAEEYKRRFGVLVMGQYQHLTLGGVADAQTLRWLSTDRARAVLHVERRLVGDFLRSTTYFREPPGSVVRFVRFADPYEGPCANPFADLSLS